MDDEEFMILPRLPSKNDTVIRGRKLPTYEQVLYSFISLYKQFIRGNNIEHEIVVRKASIEVALQILRHYAKYRIPALDVNEVADHVAKFYGEFSNLLKLSKSGNNVKMLVKLNNFKLNLDKTMPFWTKNALSEMKSNKDKLFFKSMQEDRRLSFAEY